MCRFGRHGIRWEWLCRPPSAAYSDVGCCAGKALFRPLCLDQRAAFLTKRPPLVKLTTPRSAARCSTATQIRRYRDPWYRGTTQPPHKTIDEPFANDQRGFAGPVLLRPSNIIYLAHCHIDLWLTLTSGLHRKLRATRAMTGSSCRHTRHLMITRREHEDARIGLPDGTELRDALLRIRRKITCTFSYTNI